MFVPYCYMAFNGTSKNEEHFHREDTLTNLLATTGDLAFVIHDWLFTIEIMMASLTLPTALKLLNKDVDDDRDVKDDFNREYK